MAANQTAHLILHVLMEIQSNEIGSTNNDIAAKKGTLRSLPNLPVVTIYIGYR
jgi:hypothetical protein